MMKSIVSRPSYDDVHKACASICQMMIFNQDFPTHIVALARGGLVPAIIISHMLEKVKRKPAFVSISYSSKAGNGESKDHDNVLPPFERAHILIMDDIIDGGHTMQEVYDHYSSTQNYVRTASLYYKDTAVHKPTYFMWDIPSNAPWIIFPWE